MKTSSKQLRQLMSLNMPMVALVGRSVNRPPMKQYSSSVLVFPLSSNIYSSDVSWSCVACGHEDTSDLSSLTTVAKGKSLLLKSVLLSRDEGPLVLCSVCLGTVTKLLSLTEEVEELKTRIQAVVKLRRNKGLSSSWDGEDHGALEVGPEEDDGDFVEATSIDDFAIDPSQNKCDDNDVQPDPLSSLEGEFNTIIKSEPRDPSPDSRPVKSPPVKEEDLSPPGRTCHKCGDPFKDMYDLTNHMRTVHLVTLYNDRLVCPICKAYFISAEVFDAHTHPDPINDPSKVLYICHPCGDTNTTYESKKQFQSHLRHFHRKAEMGQCHKCGKVVQCLKNHRRYTSCAPTPVKKIRKKKTKAKTPPPPPPEAVVHVHVVAKGRPPPSSTSTTCYFCGKVASRPGHLENHMRAHTGERPFVCGKCGREFMADQTLKKHVTVVCGEDGDKREEFRRKKREYNRRVRAMMMYACDRCPRRFGTKTELDRHIRRHCSTRLEGDDDEGAK